MALNGSEEIIFIINPKNRAARKIVGEWPDEKVFILISIVEQRSTLWNIALPDHKQGKDLVWQEVAAELGENEWTNCRNKWQSLRVTFKTNFAKLNKSKSGQGTSENFKVHWKFFDAMRFIATSDRVNSTESTSNLQLNLVDESEPDNIMNEVPSTPAPGRKRARTVSASSTPSSDTISARQIAEQALHLMTRSDEYSAFGDYIANELRRLTTEDAHKLKRRLTRTLLDFWDEQEALGHQMLDENTLTT